MCHVHTHVCIIIYFCFRAAVQVFAPHPGHHPSLFLLSYFSLHLPQPAQPHWLWLLARTARHIVQHFCLHFGELFFPSQSVFSIIASHRISVSLCLVVRSRIFAAISIHLILVIIKLFFVSSVYAFCVRVDGLCKRVFIDVCCHYRSNNKSNKAYIILWLYYAVLCTLRYIIVFVFCYVLNRARADKILHDAFLHSTLVSWCQRNFGMRLAAS